MSLITEALSAARRVTVVAFLFGSAWAGWQIARADHVLEFQAGPPSTLGERMIAWCLRAGLEGVGWGLVGLALALVAGAAARATAADDRADRQRGLFSLAIAALAVMAIFGSLYGREFLPFLDPLELALFDLAGFAALFAGGVVISRLARWMSGANRPSSFALGLGAGSALTAAAALVEWIRIAGPDGAVPKLAMAGGVAALSIPLATVFARLVRPLTGLLASDGPPRPLLLRVDRVLVGLAFVTLGIGLITSEHPTAAAGPGSDGPSTPASEAATPTPDRPNVVYVVVDTLRADALSCYGYPRPTSPVLDGIAAAGTRFADFSSAAPWTKPSTATLLTGLYPGRHGALFHGASVNVPEGEQALAEVFQDAGYHTAGFVTNPNVKRVFGFARGFEDFFDSPVEDTVRRAAIRSSWIGALASALSRHQFNWKYENDVRQLNRHIFGWLEERDTRPFFLYLHYIDPHAPYDPPPEYRRMFSGDHGVVLHNERKRLVGRDLYDAEIRYSDTGLGELIERLESLGDWENTIFVLTSDHGEEWFEFDALGHGYSLYQPVVGVPLIVHGPGVAQGLVVDSPVQMVDLPATICELAGLGDGELGDGVSFAPAMTEAEWTERELLFLENEFGMGQEDDDDFVHTGLRRGKWKLVHTEKSKFRPAKKGFPTEELYDLENDPLERVNLYDEPQYEDLIGELEAALAAHLEFLETEGLRGLELGGDMDAATKQQLQALGYMGD